MPVQQAFVTTNVQLVEVTSDATARVVHSRPVDENKVGAINVFVTLFDAAMNTLAVVKGTAVFARDTGTVRQPGTPDVQRFANNFATPFPTLAITPNNTGQTRAIDLSITGKAGMSIQWHIAIEFKETA